MKSERETLDSNAQHTETQMAGLSAFALHQDSERWARQNAEAIRLIQCAEKVCLQTAQRWCVDCKVGYCSAECAQRHIKEHIENCATMKAWRMEREKKKMDIAIAQRIEILKAELMRTRLTPQEQMEFLAQPRLRSNPVYSRLWSPALEDHVAPYIHEDTIECDLSSYSPSAAHLSWSPLTVTQL